MTKYNVKIREFLDSEQITYGVNCETLNEALKKAKTLTKLMEKKDYQLEITKITTKE